MNLEAVASVVGLEPTTVSSLLSIGTFPRPRRAGTWSRDSVDAWQARRVKVTRQLWDHRSIVVNLRNRLREQRGKRTAVNRQRSRVTLRLPLRAT